MLALRQVALIQPLESLAHWRSRRIGGQLVSCLSFSFQHQLQSAWLDIRQEPVQTGGLHSSESRNHTKVQNRKSTSSIGSSRRDTTLHCTFQAERNPSSAEGLLGTGVTFSADRMPAYWLLKSEPETWSWDDQVKKGVEGWDGVRNPQAQVSTANLMNHP